MCYALKSIVAGDLATKKVHWQRFFYYSVSTKTFLVLFCLLKGNSLVDSAYHKSLKDGGNFLGVILISIF